MPKFLESIARLRPLYDWTYKILMFICRLLLIGDIIITTWAVLGRYIPFITDPHWSEEIVLTFMVYMTVLSATLAIRKRAHIRMTAFDNKLPRRVIQVLDLLADLAVLALGVVLLIYGIKSVNSPLSLRGHYASLPNLSKMWQYRPVPLAGLGMIVFERELVFLHMEDFFKKDEQTKEVTGA